VKIAALGCDTSSTSCKSNRKFMFGPSAIVEDDGSISLYLGSGDREKPLNTSYYPKTPEVSNYFFKVTDKPSDAGWLTSEAVNCDGASVMCLASLSSTGDTDESTATACGGSQAIDKKGWYLGLRDTEQVVTPAATRFGITTFSTHMPVVKGNSDSCKSNLGTVHVYNLDINTASPVRGSCSSIVTGGGLPPPPEKMDICINASCTETRATCIGCSDRSSIEENPGSSPNTKRRVYWYIQQ
jgi:type IV pilus assembly protein PilY1